MNCPRCNGQNIGVTDTVPYDVKYIFRRRKCKDCGDIFRTAEFVIDEGDPMRYKYVEADRIKQTRRQTGGKR